MKVKWHNVLLLILPLLAIFDISTARKNKTSSRTSLEPIERAPDLVANEQLCLQAKLSNSTEDFKIKPWCCEYNTEKCHSHNGHCRLLWEAGSCDYTVNACPWPTFAKICTCCASCDGPQSECKSAKGTCRIKCDTDEYYASWIPCSSRKCRCCKNYCGVNQRCAGGIGKCLHISKKCPRGYYTSDHPCEGWNCRCCIPCKSTFQCWKRHGFCEGWEKNCPAGYKDHKCYCSKECRCCSRFWITGPYVGASPVRIQHSSIVEFSRDGSVGRSGGDEMEEMGNEDEMEVEGNEDEIARAQEEMANEAMDTENEEP